MAGLGEIPGPVVYSESTERFSHLTIITHVSTNSAGGICIKNSCIPSP